MRPYLLALMIVSYVALGMYDLTHGSWRLGVASVLLAAVNLLLLGG